MRFCRWVCAGVHALTQERKNRGSHRRSHRKSHRWVCAGGEKARGPRGVQLMRLGMRRGMRCRPPGPSPGPGRNSRISKRSPDFWRGLCRAVAPPLPTCRYRFRFSGAKISTSQNLRDAVTPFVGKTVTKFQKDTKIGKRSNWL